jgi:hypothetical protein
VLIFDRVFVKNYARDPVRMCDRLRCIFLIFDLIINFFGYWSLEIFKSVSGIFIIIKKFLTCIIINKVAWYSFKFGPYLNFMIRLCFYGAIWKFLKVFILLKIIFIFHKKIRKFIFIIVLVIFKNLAKEFFLRVLRKNGVKILVYMRKSIKLVKYSGPTQIRVI